MGRVIWNVFRPMKSYSCTSTIAMRYVSVESKNKASKSTSSLSEWEAAKTYEQIPGPKPAPIVGNVWRFFPVIGDMHSEDFAEGNTRMYKKYGKIVKVTNIPSRNDLVFVFDPADIAKVFRNEGAWPERPALMSLLHYRTNTRKDFFGGMGGVLADQGQPWQDARTEVNPVMMQTRTVNLYADPINKVADDFVKRIPSWMDEKNEMPESFCNELHKWALESIALIALDTRLGCLEPNLAPDSEPQKMINAVHQVFQCLHSLETKARMWKYFSTSTWRKFVAANDFFVEISMKYIERTIAKMKEHGPREEMSVVERFLTRDPNPKRLVIMTLDMLFAGVDTTSYTTANTLLHLSANQDKQEKLYKELHKIMPDPDVSLTPDMLNEMKYLKATIREGMRLNPIASSNARTTPNRIVLSGYQVPKGVDVILGNAVTGRMDEYFPEAAKFIPERWLRHKAGDTVSKEDCPFPGVKNNPFANLPFGHGARKCVGSRFANLELEILIAKLVRKFRWEYHYGDMKYKSRLVQMPVDPLRFRVDPRVE